MKELFARMSFLPTDAGGRKSPFHSGMHYTVWLGGIREGYGLDDPMRVFAGTASDIPKDCMPILNDCWIYLLLQDTVAPGEDCEARLVPISPKFVQVFASVGGSIALWDGRFIASGTVTAVVD